MAEDPNELQNCSDREFVERLAHICDRTADIVTSAGGLTTDDGRQAESSSALGEKTYFEQNYNAPDDARNHPPFWVALIASTYLPEAAHLCRGLGAQLRAGTYVVGIHAGVRAVVERIGRLKWIIDPNCEPHRRFARAGLEITVCQQFYRQTLGQLKAPTPDQRRARAEHVRYRSCLDRYFGEVEKPPSDPCDPDSAPTPDATTWTVDGESYPSYAELTSYVLEEVGRKRRSAGTYAAFCGLTHPNVQFSQEHRRFAPDNSVELFYTCADLEKSVRLACFATLDGLRYVVAYNAGDTDKLQQLIDDLERDLDSISVLE